jgi:hypothetical protein
LITVVECFSIMKITELLANHTGSDQSGDSHHWSTLTLTPLVPLVGWTIVVFLP